MSDIEIRTEYVFAVVQQLRGCKKKRKKIVLQARLRDGMNGIGYLSLPDGSACQWVKVPWLRCGSCSADMQRRDEVEIIRAAVSA